MIEDIGFKLVGFLAAALVGCFRLTGFLVMDSLLVVKIECMKGVGGRREMDEIFVWVACIELSCASKF